MGCSVSRPFPSPSLRGVSAAAVVPFDGVGGSGGKEEEGGSRKKKKNKRGSWTMRRRSGLAFRYSTSLEKQDEQEVEKEEEEEEEKATAKASPSPSSTSPPPPSPPPPFTGPLAYRLGKTLGSGGFSVVREATRLADGAKFAAKVIPLPPEDLFPEKEEEHDKQHQEKKNTSKKKKEQKQQSKNNKNKNDPPPSTRAEVEREVSCLRALPPHPNVVRLVDAFADPSLGCYVVVTELLRGGELLDALLAADGGAYGEETAALAAAQVAAALAHAHAHGVVHRDVKLDNVLLSEPGGDLRSLKLADFGLSAALAPAVAAAAVVVPKMAPTMATKEGDAHDKDDDSDEIEEREREREREQQPQQQVFGLATVCGTPAYVAPEVLAAGRGGPRYGAEADCWSLGVLIYTLLGGYQPFWAENEAELFGLIRRGEYDRFEGDEVWQGVSDEAKDLVSGLLVVDPKRRLSARAALGHPWLVAAIEAGALAPGALPAAAVEEEQAEKEEEKAKVETEEQQPQQVVSAFAAFASSGARKASEEASTAATASLASRSLSSALSSSTAAPRAASEDGLALRRAASLAQQARNARANKNKHHNNHHPHHHRQQQQQQQQNKNNGAASSPYPLPPLPPSASLQQKRSSAPVPLPPVSAFATKASEVEVEGGRKKEVVKVDVATK